MSIKHIKAYTLFDEWKLYDTQYSWYNWIMDKLGFTTYNDVKSYLYNCTNGELYKNEIVGQYGQETQDPYIYMDDSSYLRVLPEYEHIIRESEFAKKCHKTYLYNLENDI